MCFSCPTVSGSSAARVSTASSMRDWGDEQNWNSARKRSLFYILSWCLNFCFMQEAELQTTGQICRNEGDGQIWLNMSLFLSTAWKTSEHWANMLSAPKGKLYCYTISVYSTFNEKYPIMAALSTNRRYDFIYCGYTRSSRCFKIG